MSTRKKEKNVPKFLDRKAAAEYIGLSDFWLAKHKSNPEAPRYIVYGRKCWYRVSDLDAWLESRENLDDLMVHSAAHTSPTPAAKELAARFEEEWGGEPSSAVVANAVERVRRLNPKYLRYLINTLKKLESRTA